MFHFKCSMLENMRTTDVEKSPWQNVRKMNAVIWQDLCNLAPTITGFLGHLSFLERGKIISILI